MQEDSTKHNWLKITAIVLISFIMVFLAFYFALELMFNKMTDPVYNAKRIERMIQQQSRNIQKFEERIMENPFEPKMRPMIVNLVKELNEYKVIVDLKPLDGNEKLVKVKLDGDELLVTGKLDKTKGDNERITSFTQAYYLGEKLDEEKMTTEKRGEKLIITIPFTTEEEEG